MKGKLEEGSNVFGEGSQRGKHIREEEGLNNEFSFFVHSHNLMPHFPKVDLNKFVGLNPIGWVDQIEHYFSLHAIIDYLLKL
jgi:hypothetical protein